MYQIKVNDKYDFKISSDLQPTVDGEAVDIDVAKLRGNKINILYNHQSYNVEVVELNQLEKIAVVKVNGNVYSLTIKDQFDQLLAQLGMDNLAASKVLQVKAPMPGLVLNVLVNEGDEVKKGDSLLVLEAMKMENMIKSPTDGTVKKIEIKQGDKVEKNQVLISFS
ncbi:MAG: biotin/lipoyl-containing protein [Bacteroidota bacterium]